jgi:hypothetical protein
MVKKKKTSNAQRPTPNVELKRERILPIYGARIQLIVTADICAARKAQEHLFGPISGTCYDALCSRSGGQNFALFFEPAALTHRIIGHEVFHLTHRILEWVGAPFTTDNHEVFAALHGELQTWVYSFVGQRVVPDTLISRNRNSKIENRKSAGRRS